MTEQEFFRDIGQKLREFRKAKKLTQADVSVIADVDRSMLARLESSGEGIKSADIIRRLVEATGCSMSDLFPDDSKKKRNLRLTLAESHAERLNA